MYAIFLKEIRSFLGSLIGYIVMGVFLLLSGLFTWFIEGNNVFDLGMAGLPTLFGLAPYMLIFLVSAVTMRSLSEEKRLGTLETLTTRPVSDLGIIMGKYLAAVALIAISLIPTLFYAYSVAQLATPAGNIDYGALWGSYFGLILLSACYASIGLFASSTTDNQIVSLIISMVLSLFFFEVLSLMGDIEWLDRIGKSLEWFSLNFHYESISRGVLDTRDLLFFGSFAALFIALTKTQFESRKW
jgi:ABC-2 type transport system permease protein